jgi:hypothetical protein
MTRHGPKPKVRCAIYCRKSSEEGLEQSFNSLDAQREACAAYIDSQRHEGWLALDDRYDDGGYSGGTLERPALQRLIRDIEVGRVDTVICYKIDRLSRSLTDFAKPSRDETLVKALVRAHRWRRRIESGQAKSITDLAELEGVTVACRLLPLTCLAPDTVEAILDGRQTRSTPASRLTPRCARAWSPCTHGRRMARWSRSSSRSHRSRSSSWAAAACTRPGRTT